MCVPRYLGSTVHIYLPGNPGWVAPSPMTLAWPEALEQLGGLGDWGTSGTWGRTLEMRSANLAHWWAGDILPTGACPPCLAAQLAACRSDYDPMGHPRRPPPPWLLRAAKLYIVRSTDTYVASHRIHTRWVGPTPAGFSPDAYCEAFERRWYRCLRLDCLLHERIWAIGCGGTQSLPGT